MHLGIVRGHPRLPRGQCGRGHLQAATMQVNPVHRLGDPHVDGDAPRKLIADRIDLEIQRVVRGNHSLAELPQREVLLTDRQLRGRLHPIGHDLGVRRLRLPLPAGHQGGHQQPQAEPASQSKGAAPRPDLGRHGNALRLTIRSAVHGTQPDNPDDALARNPVCPGLLPHIQATRSPCRMSPACPAGRCWPQV